MLYDKNTKTYNFKDFALAYLSSARTNAQSYIEYAEKPQEYRWSGIDDYGAMGFIPAIWSFKHALECGVKFLKRMEGENIKKDHNLQNLVGELKISSTELQNMSDKWSKLSTLKELNNYRSNSQFGLINDQNNQVFHYPYNANGGFHAGLERFDYIGFLYGDNEKIMIKIMKELQEDVYETAKIIGSLMSKSPNK